MKRISTIVLFAALALLSAVSCRKENEQQPVEWRTELQAVRSNLVFFPSGGTETLEVNVSSANVTADKPWCSVSVSGNVISVTVPANESKLSRYAKLTITAGGETINAAVVQYGEVFDGLELVDMEVPKEGTVFSYPYTANMDVNVQADQDWVHISFDEEDPIVYVTVDANQGFGYRFATVSYAAGSNSGSARISQEPTPGKVSGWDVAVTGGMYDFPDQVDQLTVTPASASSLYAFEVVSKDDLQEKDIEARAMTLAASVREAVLAKVAAGEIASFADGVLSGSRTEEFRNLSRTVWGIVACFDGQGYPTGEYFYQEVAVPDRGPVKQLVDGWDAAVTDGSYAYPAQTNVFTITPKAGYESVKYVASVVKKNAVSDVEDYAFTTFAMATREAILAKVASGELASFEAGLLSGTGTVSAENVAGDVYVVVVAFGDNKFYTGDYSVIELSVSDAKRAYWTGTWTMTNTAGDSYTWTIEEKGDDSGYLTMYSNGLYTGTGSLLKSMNWVDLRYNDDGSVTVMGQIHTELTAYYNATYGDIYPGLYGFYTNAEGKVYYKTNAPYDIFTLSFNGVGQAAVSQVELASGDIPYDSFAIRYYSSVKAARFAFTSNKTITIAGLTLTKQ